MNLQDKVSIEVMKKAMALMTEKEILEITKKVLPKVMQEQIEITLQDFIQCEIDMYEILNKAGVKKKLSDIIINAIKGI